MTTAEPILVLGHRNPDTDAIASAIGYAWLLNTTRSDRYLAGRIGQVNAQTAFALDHFSIDPPTLVGDVRPRVGDVIEVLPFLQHGQSLLEACQSIARTRRPAALLDGDHKPLGLLTGAGLFANLADALSSTSVLALAKEFDRPAQTAIDHIGIILKTEEYIQDIMSQVLRAGEDDFLVVDNNGSYAGLCRKSNLISAPRRKVVMVDHNELAQAVPGLEEAEIVEVLDHHRLSSMPTQVPIRIVIEPVGSCSTLVTERGLDLDVKFPREVAGMLLCGILSDTLIFRSPTATERDRAAARALAVMAELVNANASDEESAEAIEALGGALLAAGAGLGTRPASDIVSTDIKYYEVNDFKVGIAQVEVTTFSELAARLDDLRDGLRHLIDAEKLTMALLMVTDVVRGNSRLIVVGQPRIISSLPYPRLSDDILDAPGVVSRKKQLLPTVLAALSQNV